MPSLKSFLTPQAIFLKYDPRRCPSCGEELFYEQQSSGRGIFRLNGWFRVASQLVCCGNGRCPLRRTLLHPPQEFALAAPRMRVGTDAWAKVGRLRFAKHMRRADIRELLVEEDGFEISERKIEDLFKEFGALAAQDQLRSDEVIGRLKASGKLVVSLDAAKPLKDDDAVWFIRDTITGLTLVASALASGRTEDLVALLEPVAAFAKRHRIPVLGVVSDAERVIRAAVKEVFPKAPHQLCQIHLVSNVAKPLRKKDNELRKELRDSFRGLNQTERDGQEEVAEGTMTSKQGKVFEELVASVRSVLRDSGKAPLRPGGLILYERLLELRQVLRAMLKRRRSGAGRALLEMLEVLSKVSDKAKWLREYYADVLEIGTILFHEGQTASGAKRQLRELSGRWEDQLAQLTASESDQEAAELLNAWQGLMDSYWPGLFHCYGNPYLPATNNGTEKLIGQLKRLEQFLANNSRPASRFVRNAPHLALLVNRQQLPGEAFLASRRSEDFRKAKAYLQARRERAGMASRARADFSGVLKGLEERWNNSSDTEG